MLRNIFIINLLFLTSFFSIMYAQDSKSSVEWAVKFALSPYKTNTFISTATNDMKQKVTANYQAELDCILFKYFEAGIYGGYSYCTGAINTHFLTYGLNINYYLLSQLKSLRNFRFDLYLTGKFGDNYNINKFKNYHTLEYGLGGGLSFAITRRLELFLEYTWGQYFYEDNRIFRAGLNYCLTN